MILLRFSQLRLSVAVTIAGLLLADTLLLLHVGLFTGGVAMLGLVIPITPANFLIGRRGLLLCIGLSITIVTAIGILQYVPTPLAGLIQTLFPASAVLFISGYTDNAIVHHGQLDPEIIFLQKPFSPAALAGKVREVLDSGVG